MKIAHLRPLGALLLGLFVALAPAVSMAKRGKKKRQVKRYHLTLHNVNTKEKVTNLWVIRTDPKNKNRQWVGKRARKRLTHFLRDWRTGRTKHVPERLLWYLYLIGQRYDAPIEIVSAYRHKERRSSRHKQGRAVDIRIKGVSPKALWRYCKRFNRVGLGYYPNSGFVHLDVRKKSYYWIDDSGPGEKARYRSHVSQGKGKKAKKRKKGSRHARSGKGSKAKSARVKATKPKAKVEAAPEKKAPKEPEKRRPAEPEDAPSAGPKTPTAAPPKKAKTVKRPLTRPVRPTAGVKAPTIKAPTVKAPTVSRPSAKSKKAKPDESPPKKAKPVGSQSKKAKEAAAKPKKAPPAKAGDKPKKKSAAHSEDAPPKTPSKSKGK